MTNRSFVGINSPRLESYVKGYENDGNAVLSLSLDLTIEAEDDLGFSGIDSAIKTEILNKNSVYGPPISLTEIPTVYNKTLGDTVYELI